ncbi:MAG: phytoene desaturase family protein [Candidatus Odinarchaeota archaeon]
MSRKSIIIIGAGLGGLSTGCYAQMNGYQSQIFEQHSKPGGLAASWKRKDYLIDGGIHFVSGHKPGVGLHNVYREIGADKARFVDMDIYGRFIDKTSGKTVDITSNLDKLESNLLALFPRDEGIIKEIISGSRAMTKTDITEVGFTKPAELMGWRDKLGDMWKIKGLMKYFSGKYSKTVKEYVKDVNDPILGDLLMNLFLPEVPVWFILMVLGLLGAGQIALLEDGALAFAKTIEKRYTELGGKVTYKADVKEILVSEDRATGVRLASGSIHQADVVISAADGYHTIYELLAGKYLNEKIEKRYRTWKNSYPMVLISYGVAWEFKGEPWMIVTSFDRPISVANRDVERCILRICNYGSNFAPPNKTVVQVEFETEWNYWHELRKDKQKYDVEKERIATEVLEQLENIYQGITAAVEITDVATPHTYWRYTRNRGGSIMGWDPTPETIFASTEKNLPGLDNFYIAGQWSMSVGGVQPAIYSGKHVIQLICHEDKKKFRTIPRIR